jgi:glycosyltransferase involved in cell wall biosynthesis
VITVSEILASEIKKSYPFKSKDVYCIENGFDPDRLQDTNIGYAPKPVLKKKLIYLGTLYSQRRYPEPLFAAVEKNYQLFKEKLEIVFYGPYETKLVLCSLFDRYPLASKIIRYRGFISAQEAIKREAEADALLFVENDRKDDGVVTGKIFEYLMFKKPILCIGVKASSWVGRFLDRTGLCIFCQEDALLITESLRLLIEGRIDVHADEAYISSFSRENQVKKLNDIFTKYAKG